jgi:hypothetical protein
MRELFVALFIRIEVGAEQVSLAFRSIELRRFLCWNGQTTFRSSPSEWLTSDARYVLDVAVSATSGQHKQALVHIDPRNASAQVQPDNQLVAILRTARTALRLMEEHRDLSTRELAALMDCGARHFARLIRLNYLAPDIVTAILDGTQPANLTRTSLMRAHVPMDWSLQRTLLGFSPLRRSLHVSNLYGRGLWPRLVEDSTK